MLPLQISHLHTDIKIKMHRGRGSPSHFDRGGGFSRPNNFSPRPRNFSPRHQFFDDNNIEGGGGGGGGGSRSPNHMSPSYNPQQQHSANKRGYNSPHNFRGNQRQSPYDRKNQVCRLTVFW